MKALVLDSREDGNQTCYLCKISLEDYLVGLPRSYRDYDIQREIVTNVYLDNLVETVLAKQHIPPIVLVVSKRNLEIEESANKKTNLKIKSFKILDGLQRTHRLKIIKATIDYCLKNLSPTNDILSLNKFAFSRRFSEELRSIDSNTNILRQVLEAWAAHGKQALTEALSKNYQWFEVWVGLSAEAEVKKMLTLNAGHKPVKTRHQLELLFLNLLPTLQEEVTNTFNITREKEIPAAQFSKQRPVGSFHFAHIITSLLSLFEGKAVAPSTGLIQSIQGGDKGIEEYSEFTHPEFLKKFVKFLVRVDERLSKEYPNIGSLWVGREVSLSGLFGAIGRYSQEQKQPPEKVMKEFLDFLNKYPRSLNLAQYEEERNNLDLSKVNIGNANRAAIFNAVFKLLHTKNSKPINWPDQFKGAEK